MYNSLMARHLKLAIGEFEAFDESLGRMLESGTWQDCSETNPEEIQRLRRTTGVLLDMTKLALSTYFTE